MKSQETFTIIDKLFITNKRARTSSNGNKYLFGKWYNYLFIPTFIFISIINLRFRITSGELDLSMLYLILLGIACFFTLKLLFPVRLYEHVQEK